MLIDPEIKWRQLNQFHIKTGLKLIYSDFLVETPGSSLGPAHHLLAPGVQVKEQRG